MQVNLRNLRREDLPAVETYNQMLHLIMCMQEQHMCRRQWCGAAGKPQNVGVI
jgi:hypothetical protein